MALDEKTQNDILKTISLSGAADASEAKTIQLVLDSRNNLNSILNLSAGKPRIRSNVIEKFRMILSRPVMLNELHAGEIRCCMCKQVISYPCWYYSIQYMVNHFHYFVCFDETNSTKPTARCYKRDV